MNIDNKQESTMQSRLLKNGMRLYIFAVITMPMQYVIRFMVSNALTPAEMGIIATVMWAVSILAAYVDLWLREALNYYIPKYIHHKHYDKTTTLVRISFIIQTWLWIIISAILWRQADNIAASYRNMDVWYLIKIFSINLVVSNLFSWIDGLFLVVQDVIWNKALDFLRYIVYLVYILYIWSISIADKLFSYSIYYLIWSSICVVLSIIILLIKHKKIFFWGKFDLKSIQYRPIQKYAFSVLIMMNLWMLLGQLDVQFALKLVSAEWAWYYNNWLIIVNGVIVILSVIWALVYPMISELDAKQDHHKTNLLTGILLKYIWIISAVLWIFIRFFGVYMCVMFFGIDYIISWETLKRVALFTPFWTLIGVLYMILAGKWNVWNRIWAMIWWLMVMMIGSYFTTKILGMGINGIALSLWLTWFTLFLVWYKWLVKTGIEHSRDRWFIISNIVVATIYCALVIKFYQINIYGNRLNILIELAIIFWWYICVLWISNYQTIKNLLGEIWFIKK